jgi:hypothetical protein
VGKYLTVNLPKPGSKWATVKGTIDAIGLLENWLTVYRDKAPDEQWKGLVIDTQFALRHALTPYTWEDDGDTVLTVEFPRETVAVVMEAAMLAESQLDTLKGIAP